MTRTLGILALLVLLGCAVYAVLVAPLDLALRGGHPKARRAPVLRGDDVLFVGIVDAAGRSLEIRGHRFTGGLLTLFVDGAAPDAAPVTAPGHAPTGDPGLGPTLTVHEGGGGEA